MSLGKFAFNLGTSIVFGPVKYGYKFLTEPENRGRNLVFLGGSFVGLGIAGDIVEASVENGTDLADSSDVNYDKNLQRITGDEVALNGTELRPSQTLTDAQIQMILDGFANDLSNQNVESISGHEVALNAAEPSSSMNFENIQTDLEYIQTDLKNIKIDLEEYQASWQALHTEIMNKLQDELYTLFGFSNDLSNVNQIETINDSLVGSVHPETGVHFEENSVWISGREEVIGTFPEFEPVYEYELPQSMYLESDASQFEEANEAFYAAIERGEISEHDFIMSESDYYALENGETPEHYVWHHSEEPGVLQLVDEEIHKNTGHSGGRLLWGGGKEFR